MRDNTSAFVFFLIAAVFALGRFVLRKLRTPSEVEEHLSDDDIILHGARLYDEAPERVVTDGGVVRIRTAGLEGALPIDERKAIAVDRDHRELVVVVDGSEVIRYTIEHKDGIPESGGLALHLSVRVERNWALMIDGLFSSSMVFPPDPDSLSTEGVRFQPLFIGETRFKNQECVGKGLLARGLHYPGFVTPKRVKPCCVCDSCRKSFTISSFHAGFSMGQYFYSSDSSETLFMPGMPTHFDGVVSPAEIVEIENRLPKPKVGEFKYWNSFRCPHCKAPYIDSEKFPEERNKEYYGNTYLNCVTVSPPLLQTL